MKQHHLRLLQKIINLALSILMLTSNVLSFPVHAEGEETDNEQIEKVYYCDTEEHSHSDECYKTFYVLECDEDHIHDESCLKSYSFLVCDKKEHTHDERCEDPDFIEETIEENKEKTDEELIIEKAINNQENYTIICDKQEHTHSIECFNETVILNCEENHEHNDDCFMRVADIICGQEEHIHTIDCVSENNEEEETETVQSDSDTLLESPDEVLLQKDNLTANTLMLTTSGLKAAPTAREPVEADGVSIQSVTVKWLSNSTGTDYPATYDDLMLTPENDIIPNQQFQIDFSISGKGTIPAGSVEVVIPAFIWKTKEGNEPGVLTLAVPQEPSTKQDFAYKRVGDTIVLTNTKSIPTTARYMIQGTFRMTSPDANAVPNIFTSTYAHEMYDLDTVDDVQYKDGSDELKATITVETPRNHDIISMTSNSIRAKLDTRVAIGNVSKKLSRVYTTVPSTIPAELLPENPEDYIYIQWYVSATVTGNQAYDLYLKDSVSDTLINVSNGDEQQVNGLMLGVSNSSSGNHKSQDGKNIEALLYSGYNLDSNYSADISSKTAYVWTAYPKADLKAGVSYTANNVASVEVTGQDDKITSSKSSSDKANLRLPAKWTIKKIWNDEDDKEGYRPDSLKVWLYDADQKSGKDYKIIATFELNEGNNWQVVWTDNGNVSNVGAREVSWDATEDDFVTASGYDNNYKVLEDGSKETIHWYYTYNSEQYSYDEDTHTFTFANDFHKSTEVIPEQHWNSTESVISASKSSTSHKNQQLKATSDRDLSLLSKNKETSEIIFKLDSVATIAPYTLKDGGNASNREDYGYKQAELRIEDKKFSLSGLDGNNPLTANDYEIRYVYLDSPKLFERKQKDRWSAWQWSELDNTVGVNLYGKIDNEWILFASMDENKNIVVSNGAEVVDPSQRKIILPENVTNVYTSQKSNEERISASYRVGIILKPSERIRDYIDSLFMNSDYILRTVDNSATSTVYDEDNQAVLTRNYNCVAYLHGRNYRLAADLDKTYVHSFTNTEGRYIEFKAAITLNQQTNITTENEMNDALSHNDIAFSESGVFYDLLPQGMSVELSSVEIDGGSIISAEAIENYKGSGRTLVYIRVRLSDDNKMRSYSSSFEPAKYLDKTYPDAGFYRGTTVSFNTQLTFDEARNRGGLSDIRNTAAYEANEDELGNCKYWIGEPDNPAYGNNKESANAVGSDVVELMSNLDENREDPVFVYAQATARMTEVDLSARISIHKYAQVSGSEEWKHGHDNDVNVQESGKYSYQMVVSGSQGITGNIIMIDSLENYAPMVVTDIGGSDYKLGDIISRYELGYINAELEIQDKQPITAEPVKSWSGYLRSIDLSEIRTMGVDPVVYYSTVDNIDLSGYNPTLEEGTIDSILNDPNGIWTKTAPDNLSEVKAIAIDCSRKTDGTAFELEGGQSLIAYVHMIAPSHDENPEAFAQEDYYDFRNNAHAFNGVYVDYTHMDETGKKSHHYDSCEYTKIGIYSANLKIKKIWDDDNNRDGIRPDSITVKLLRNGIETDRTITLTKDNNYEGVFEYVPRYDDDGRLYIYSVKEKQAEGYKSVVSLNGDVIEVKNIHEPERINLGFEKKWESNEPEGWENNIPESIVLKLYADDVFTGIRKTVYPDRYRKWSGEFSNLLKYRDGGQEIEYSIKEDVPENFRVKYSDDFSVITNEYYPYGDLEVIKRVDDAPAAAPEKEFTFTLSLLDGNGEELIDKYAYSVIDTDEIVLQNGVANGVGNGDQIKLKAGQKLVIKDIPSGTQYHVSESPVAGFTLTSSIYDSGVIDSRKVSIAEFTNTYYSEGFAELEGYKYLTGRTIRKNNFRFELSDEEGNLINISGNDHPVLDSDREDWEENYAKINFTRIRFTNKDDGITRTYFVKEVDRKQSGFTYDDSLIKVVITPHDNGDGTMSFDIGYFKLDKETGEYESIETIRFDNEYEAEGQIVLKAWKTLDARKLENNEFIFDLYDEEGTLVSSQANEIDGSISFAPIKFTQNNAGKKYKYIIREKIPSEPDETVVYDKSVFAYEVSVIDMGDGTLRFSQKPLKPIMQQVESPVDETIKETRVAANNPATTYILKDNLYEILAGIYDNNNNTDGELSGYKLFIDNKQYQANNVNFSYSENVYTLSFDSLQIKADENSTIIITDDEGINISSRIKLTKQDIKMVDGDVIVDFTEEGASLPIFKNTLKNGDLKVTKKTRDTKDADPNEEFRFRVRFLGENLIMPDINIELSDDVAPEEGELILEGKATIDRAKWLSAKDGYEGSRTLPKAYQRTTSIQREYEMVLSEVENIEGVERIDDESTDRKIYRWVEDDVFWWWSDAEKVYLPENSSYFFSLHQSGTGEQSKNFDLTGFDTSKVTDMSYMFFYSHNSFNTIDISNWDTSKVTNMSHMFVFGVGCSELDLSSFNTSNVTDMSYMFGYNEKLENIYVSDKWNTAHVTKSNDMFSNTPLLPGYDNNGSQDISKAHYSTGGYLTYKPYNTVTPSDDDIITDPYTIKFDAGEGQGIMKDVQASAGKDYKLPSSIVAYPGHKFKCWKDNDGKEYNNCGVINANSFAQGSTLVLTAQYEERDVTISTIAENEYEFVLLERESMLFKNIPAGTTYQVYELTTDGWVIIEHHQTSGQISPLHVTNAIFVNQYQPEVTSVQLIGTKMHDNKPADEGLFGFELWEGDNLISTVHNSNGGFIQFPVITYKQSGNHVYTIKEVNTGDEKLDFDTHEETVTVNVTDNGEGKLSYKVTYDEDGIVFSNRTKPGSLMIHKTTDFTSEASNDEEFTVKITFTNPNGTPLSDDESIYYYLADENGNPIVENNNNNNRPFNLFSYFTNLFTQNTNEQDYNPVSKAENKSWSDLFVKKVYAEENDSDVVQSGTYDGVDWKIVKKADATHELQIGKENETQSFTNRNRSRNEKYPWKNHKELIDSVTFVGNVIGNGKMPLLFADLSKAKTIDISSFDTSNVTDLQNMCSDTAIESFSFANNDLSKVTTLYGAFADCTNLTNVDFGSGNLSMLINLDYAFSGTKISGDIVKSMRLSKSPSVKGLFSNVVNKQSYDLSGVDLSGFRDMGYMFESTNPILIDFTGTKVDEAVAVKSMFKNTTVDDNLNVVGLDTSKFGNMFEMFNGLSSKGTVDLSWWATNSSTNISYSLYDVNAEKVILGDKIIRNNATLSCMFASEGTSVIKELDISKLDLRNVGIRNAYMFENNGIHTIVLGENMRFAENCLLTTRHYPYYEDGVWVQESTGDVFTPEQLKDYFADDNNTDKAGRYVRKHKQIQLDPNGGVNIAGHEYLTLDETVIIPGSEVVSKPGSELIGWSDENDTVRYEIGQEVAVTDEFPSKLKAVWKQDGKNSITVVHYQQTLSGNGYTIADREVYRDSYNKEYLIEPKKYTGFYTEGVAQNVVIPADEDIVIEYRYNRNRYTVQFDGNGATSGQMLHLINMVGNVSYTLPANNYSKKGSIFLGWNTEADGSGISIYDKQDIVDIGENNEKVVLYAQWQDNDHELSPSEGVVYVKIKAGQRIVFPDLPYETSYTIEEVDIPDGWSLERTSGVTGTIKALQRNNATLHNVYAADGQAYIVAHKKMIGAGVKPGQFSFELVNEQKEVLQTVTNGEIDNNRKIAVDNGTVDNPWYDTAIIQFDPIQFDISEIGDHVYYIREVNGGVNNIEYDETEYKVTVRVSDLGRGNLMSTVMYEDDEPLFINTMSAGQLEVVKKISNYTDVSKNQEFNFELKLNDSDGKTIDGTYNAKIVHEDNTVDNPHVSEVKVSTGQDFSIKGNEKIVIYGLPHGASYEVIEKEIAGWSLFESNNAVGTIDVNNPVTVLFSNVYSTTGGIVIDGRKNYHGGDISSESFEFELTDMNNNLLSTATTDENGYFYFDGIQYDQEDVGNVYTYYISEKIEEIHELIDKWDERLLEVNVEVKDKGDGTIDAKVTYDKGDNVFHNYILNSLTVQNGVYGNYADQGLDFRYLLKLDGDIHSSDIKYTKELSNGTVETGSIKGNEFAFTLKHGERIVFDDIVAGVNYDVVQYWQDDYETSARYLMMMFARRLGANVGDGIAEDDGLHVKGTLDRDKSIMYTNIRDVYQDITVSKYVVGEDKNDKKFNFTVELSNLEADMTYESSFGEFNADSDGKYTNTFTLKDGESVTFSKLPAYASYSVTEDDYSERYETSIIEGYAEAKVSGNKASGSIKYPHDVEIKYYNKVKEVSPEEKPKDNDDGSTPEPRTYEYKVPKTGIK